MKIAIAGAGLVGSLLAILLRQRGHEVFLYEKRKDPRLHILDGGRSINLVITSRGLNGLKKAGLVNKINELAVPVYGRMMHSKTGDTTYQAYGQRDDYNLSISRGELNRFLIDEAEKAGAKVYFDHDLIELNPQKKEITFTNSEKISYDILFGADGAGSSVRKKLKELFTFNEKTEWLEADYKELTLPLDKSGESQLKTSALHIWPRGGHMMMALANHNGSFTVTLYLPKTGSSVAFDKIKTEGDVINLFKTEFPDAVAMMPDFTKEFLSHPQGALGTVRCSQWVFNNSIALIGDAAHAIVPFFGQGMNCGFEDCTALIEILEKNKNDWQKTLNEYEAARKPNAQAIADMALENFVEMRDKVGDPQFLERKKIESLLEKQYPDLYISRYGMITYTLVPYALAQKAGIKQNEIINQLSKDISSADKIIKSDWSTFVKENNLDIKKFRA